MHRTAPISALPLAVLAVLAHGQTPREPWQDVYLQAGVGAGFAANGELDGAGATVDFDLGRPIGSLALGLRRPGGWRFELDASYRYNDAEVVFFDSGAPDVAPDSDSRISALGAALSLIRDFDAGGRFRPFLGAGLGAARIDYELRQFITGVELLDDSDTALTYQLIAGAGLALSPRLDLALEYRFWHAPDIELDAADGAGLSTDHQVHSLSTGLRYQLLPRAPRAPVGARRHGGWYLQGALGPSFAKDAEIKNNIANFDAFDVGYAASLAAGYAWSGPWRLELELAQRRNEAELVDFNPEFGEDRANGRVSAVSVMANVIYEPAWQLPFQPYALVGLGGARSSWNVRLDASDSTYVDDEDSATAFQVGIGASAPLTERLAVSTEYRYWQTGLFDLEEPDGRPMRTELAVHALILALRFTPGR